MSSWARQQQAGRERRKGTQRHSKQREREREKERHKACIVEQDRREVEKKGREEKTKVRGTDVEEKEGDRAKER